MKSFFDEYSKMTRAVNAITKNPLSKIDALTKTAITSQSFVDAVNVVKGINYKFAEAVVALSKIVNPYIIKATETLSVYEKAYRAVIKDQYEYKLSIQNKWRNLEEELKGKNRYFPKSELLTIFEILAKEAKCYLKKGTVLYRARKISEQELPKDVINLLKYVLETMDKLEQDNQVRINKDIITFIEEMTSEEWKQNYLQSGDLQNLLFWGYEVEGSDAPKNNTSHGRANPPGISYLYTASDVNTAISEIQPTIEQLISIAKITTSKRFNIFDFSFPGAYKNAPIMKKHMGEIKEQFNLSSFWELEIFFNTISDFFSKPTLGNTEYYYTTQYLSELLKNMGFDGIKYKSSLKKKGANIVLFDTSKDENGNLMNYQIQGSSLYRVENVRITSKIVLPKKIK